MDDSADEVLGPLRRPLVAVLALYVGDRGVAEELAQEALLRALRDWSRVRDKDQPGAWVYRVAFNLARSRWRRRMSERRAYGRLGYGSLGPVGASTGEGGAPVTNRIRSVSPTDVEGHERTTTTSMVVREAVEALPPRYRQVVACRYLADLSVAETAVVMGCAEGTVKSLTHKALAALRDAGLEEVALDA